MEDKDTGLLTVNLFYTSPNWTPNRNGSRSGSFGHLNDSVRVSGEHLPLVGWNFHVIFALYAIQCHCILRLDHPVRASVSHRWTVRFIWRETAVHRSVYKTTNTTQLKHLKKMKKQNQGPQWPGMCWRAELKVCALKLCGLTYPDNKICFNMNNWIHFRWEQKRNVG